ncbi:acetate--CoA ligase family protein [Corticibacterium sp. UT-5YL-CI-8]|nr:acetate--CoA ligase family protein [Tianweitania sp. UT-5YL-CI-8]
MTSGTSPSAMRALMAPRSIAIVGATERPDASSSFVMRNLMTHGFDGRILPVNPRGGSVFGYAAATSLSDLAEPADVAVIGISAERVLPALEEAARNGIKAAVILASGFAELDDAGRRRQDELVDLARKNGMAICGPNCLGLFNLNSGAALYSSRLSTGMLKGGLALVSHSGATAIALGNTGRIGISHIVSSGNSAATDIPDYLHYLATDDATKVIGVVLEAIRDPQAFARAMQTVHAAGKPVIVLRAGRSESGARATAAHTGSLAGAGEAYTSFFRRNGVIEAGDMDEFIEAAALCIGTRRSQRGKGIAVLGVSGGGVAHVSDIAEETGISLPRFHCGTVAALRTLLPPFATPQNPLDTTGVVFADAAIYGQVLDVIAADPGIGLIVAAQDAPAGLDQDGAAEYLGIAGAAADFAKQSETPVVFMSNLSSGHHPAVKAAAAQGVTVMNGTRATLRAIKAVMDMEVASLGEGKPLAEPDPTWLQRIGSGDPLTEREAKAFLAANGLPTTKEYLVTSADEAAAAAGKTGFPVVLKIESPDIAHKTEAGGVRLGVASGAEAREAFETIIANARAYAPKADLRGVVVQEMVTGGVEALVGLVRHEPFGLGLVVGVGGVLVELIKDAAFELLPIDKPLALDMIGRTKLAQLLAGYRGAPAADTDALADLMVALSDAALRYDDALEAIDLNPVAVLPKGRGVRLLDALVIGKKPD